MTVSTGSARAVLDRAVGRITGTAQLPLAAAIGLGLLATAELVLRSGPQSGSEITLGLLVAWAGTLPVAVAGSHPLAATGAIMLANLLALASGQPPTAAALAAQLAGLYLLGRAGFGRPSSAALRRQAGSVLAAVVGLLAFQQLAAISADHAVAGLVLMSVSVVAAGLGATGQARDEAVERAVTDQTFADTLLAHAARGERARIARELHDVVAHHISMIAVQAETARLVTPGMPAEGTARLLAIGDTARTALTEMRRLLGVLRQDTGVEPRAPQPGLQQLNELVDDARGFATAGARLIVRGQVAPLDVGIELTAYRLVQEALTNARRHAPGAAVDVELNYTDTALRLTIRDNGPGTATPAGGHGLLGMRERAATVGGTVTVGPAPGSGFLVHATLPRTGR